MRQIEVTFSRATKFWWSLTWRTLVLTLPIMFVVEAMMVSSMLADPEQAMDPASFGSMLMTMIPALLVSAVLSVVAMVYATRWALRTKWSDFRVLVVAPEAGSPPS